MSPQTTAMHSDCIFRKEEALCLEKIQRANDLMGLNDSSPGEQGGGVAKVSLAYPGWPSELLSQPLATS